MVYACTFLLIGELRFAYVHNFPLMPVLYFFADMHWSSETLKISNACLLTLSYQLSRYSQLLSTQNWFLVGRKHSLQNLQESSSTFSLGIFDWIWHQISTRCLLYIVIEQPVYLHSPSNLTFPKYYPCPMCTSPLLTRKSLYSTFPIMKQLDQFGWPLKI